MSDPARHVHQDGEALCALALDRGAGDALRAEVRRCAVCRAELERLEVFFARSRSALERGARVPKARTDALHRRVLAQTTRERPGFSGDLRLVGAFVGARLRSSRALRLAAASLLVHLLALPVLAWYVLRVERRADLVIRVPPEELTPPFEQEVEEVLEPLVVPAMDGLDLEPLVPAAGVDLARVENSIRLARYALSAGAPPMPPPSADEGWIERALRARAEAIGAFASGREPPAPALGPPEAEGAGDLERALWADLCLDRWVLGPAQVPELAAALAGLCPAGAGAARVLAAAALARAEACGLAGERERACLALERRAALSGEDARRLIEAGEADPSARRVAPLERAWIEALERALPQELRERPVPAAWLAFGR